MTIRKYAGVLLALVLFAGTAGAAIPLSRGESTSARAAEAVKPVTIGTDNASLFLPSSYEQYLPLTDPNSVAVNDSYVAIADQNGGTSYIYIYERATGSYRRYKHTTADSITKIQFSASGELYFADSSAASILYRLKLEDAGDLSAESIHITRGVGTFLIEGETLYVASVNAEQGRSSLYAFPLSSPTEGAAVEETINFTNPLLTYANGWLYCAVTDTAGARNYHVYAYPVGSGENAHTYTLTDGGAGDLTSVCFFGGALCFTTATGIYAADLAANTVTPLIEEAGCTALTLCNDTLYCVDGTSVRQIAYADGSAAFTDYEIAGASDSVGRLSGATDMARAGDLIVTADAGNNRISVCNTQTGAYTVYACESAPALVATDGETIAYAARDGHTIYACTYGDAAFAAAGETDGTVQGLAVLYGDLYYTDGTLHYGRIAADHTATVVQREGSRPLAIAADIFGNLYVSFEDGSVRRFTEEEFLTREAQGADTGVTLPSGATSLECDYDGNLYYLSDGKLYQNDALFAEFGENFVWKDGQETDVPVAFALGYQDDAVYFGFGNYIVTSAEGALSAIPTLSEIAVEEARATAFSFHAADGLLVDVPAGTVGVATDLNALRAEETAAFPYRGYARSTLAREGVLLARTQKWALVLFADGGGAYTAELVPAAAPQTIASEEYYTPESGAVRFASSDVSLYYAPCLSGALADIRLSRGDSVSLQGVVRTAELSYAIVEIADGERAAVRGYVPLSYLTPVFTSAGAGGSYTLAYLKSDREGVLFTAADGSEQLVTERVEVRLYENGDGTYTAVLTGDPAYSAQIDGSMIDEGNAEVIRIALIVILSVLALVILGVYLYLLPWEKYRKKER